MSGRTTGVIVLQMPGERSALRVRQPGQTNARFRYEICKLCMGGNANPVTIALDQLQSKSDVRLHVAWRLASSAL